MYQPYTYLIEWTDHNVFYYGVRYNQKIRGKTPEQDLWVDYFTSSKYVQEFREEHGDPDRIEVRKVFDSADTARNWETKFLKRIRAVEKENWLNKTYSDGRWYNSGHSEEVRRKMSEARKNVSEETRRKIGEAAKGRKHSVETRKKISEANKRRKISEETLRKMSEAKKGRRHSEDHKRKMSEAQKGRKFSEAHKRKISEALKGKKGKKWFTNGEKIILINPNKDIIPPGFVAGRYLK